MLKSILYIIINALALLAFSNLGTSLKVSGFRPAVIFVLALTLLNWTVVPIIKFFSWPLNFLSFGILHGIINLLTLLFLTRQIDGITMEGGFLSQFITLILISVVFGFLQGWMNNQH